MKDVDDFLAEVRKKYERAADKESGNRERALGDIRHARLNEQWPEGLKKLREDENRPCLTNGHLQSMIRLVVNEARQNRPAITVIPADSNADPDTAEIMSGLIRNIEVASDADIAYDTAIDGAVSGGFGYFRINTAYTSDDNFDQDIVIERIADPFTVYGDPEAESADGSDWNCCYIVKVLTKDEFTAKYKDKDAVDWDDLGYTNLKAPWCDGDNVMVAEYWHRTEEDGQIVALSDGSVVPIEVLSERAEEFAAAGIMPVGEPRTVKRKKVKQYILSGAEILSEMDWPGKYIPVIPVYGDEITVEGDRYFKSLIHDAISQSLENNFWRSSAAELVGYAPKIPYVGPVGAFNTDVQKWSTANSISHAFIEYDGPIPPQRQPGATLPGAEMQQAQLAVEDMRATVGLFEPSLGQQRGDSSGVAIRQLRNQGSVGTFHFIDNLTRAIRQAGRILIDLIPKVYGTARVLRVLGQNMEPQNVQVQPGAPPQDQQAMMAQQAQQMGQKIARIYDLTAGKYDLVVKAGPAYGTAREEARDQIIEIIRSFPPSAEILGPMFLRNSDWPGAEEAADKLEQGGQAQGDPNAGAQLAQMQQQMMQLQLENQQLKADSSLKLMELQIKNKEADTKAQEVAVNGQLKSQELQLKAMGAARQAAAEPSSNPYSQGLG